MLPRSLRPRHASLRARVPAALAALLLAVLMAACGGGGGGGGGTGNDRAELQVTVSGLPTGTAGVVTVTGPNGFNRNVSTSGAITGLVPGTYAIAAATTENDTARYVPSPASQSVTLAEGETKPAAVAYALSTGRIAVTITGLPAGVDASVRVVRAPAFAQTLSGSATLSKLLPGSYTVTADTIESGGITYPGTPRTQTVNVTASYTPAPAPVSYGPQPGSLTVTVNGLPVAIPANVTVTGPGGFNQAVTATTTFPSLESGTYTVAALAVMSGGDTFNPTPTTQQVNVSTGAPSEATVTYASANGQTLNLSIGRFYLTQSVQRPNNTVPLVPGKPALARVFVVANQANAAQPVVRLRFFQGAAQVREDLIPAPTTSVPLAVTEANLGSTWNVVLPEDFLQPGMTVQVLVDPSNAVAESAESDNGTLPDAQSGVLPITTTPAFNVTMIPVTQSAAPGSPTGAVSGANLSSWLYFTRRIHPLSTLDAVIRTPYTTETVLQAGGIGWSTLLSELQALKITEGSTRYYYGVAKVNYSSGVAGIGYVPDSGADAAFRVALGWDHLPSGGEVAAHEWGHNFGRLHAPCGGPSGLDPTWPSGSAYVQADIGQWGWDNAANALREPSTYKDVMSYCDPQWISDHTLEGVLDFRVTVSYATQGAAVEGLLVWGRIEDGQVVLEPAFTVGAPASADRGDWTVEAVDEAGGRIAGRRFSAALVADLPGETHTFAFVLPLDPARRNRVAALRVSGPGGSAERRATPLPPGARAVVPQASVERAGDRTRLRWDPARFGAALIRDAATGEVLTIVRDGGAAEVVGARGDLEVSFSDGVRSTRARVAR
ncbi:MAG TPA: zinc-dependent metalloprotease family protein [Gemmatimonadales bacterium]|nr:zinc-dependent metalloprotease family protein [Gemmatimonadales bacterium]